MYVLDFHAQPQGAKFFEICFVAINGAQVAPAVGQWADVVSLVRKLRHAGTDLAGQGQPENLVLNPDAAAVSLERSEMRKLQEFIEQPIWRPTGIEVAMETLEWLRKTPEDPGSHAADARPEQRRRALALEKE